MQPKELPNTLSWFNRAVNGKCQLLKAIVKVSIDFFFWQKNLTIHLPLGLTLRESFFFSQLTSKK